MPTARVRRSIIASGAESESFNFIFKPHLLRFPPPYIPVSSAWNTCIKSGTGLRDYGYDIGRANTVCGTPSEYYIFHLYPYTPPTKLRHEI
ncbi:hypothetical protein ACLOJK_023618 [Asimina triloba]